MVVTELLNSSLYDALSCKDKSMFAVTYFKDKAINKGDIRIQHLKFQPKLEVDEVITIIDHCFQGLAYLHSKQISHRDLSSPNILLQVDLFPNFERVITAKLCDFGMSTIAPYDSKSSTCLENNFYSAPEANSPRPRYDGLSVDIYSLGVVIVECFMNQLSQSRTINQCRTKRISFLAVSDECKMRINGSKFRAYKPLLERMISHDPKQRPSVQNAYGEWKDCAVFDVAHAEEDTTAMEFEGDTKMDVDSADDPSTTDSTDNEAFEFLREKYPAAPDELIISMLQSLKSK
eukprot:gene12741-14716_t